MTFIPGTFISWIFYYTSRFIQSDTYVSCAMGLLHQHCWGDKISVGIGYTYIGHRIINKYFHSPCSTPPPLRRHQTQICSNDVSVALCLPISNAFV